MQDICSGTEQSDWNLYSGETLEIDGGIAYHTLESDALVQVEVQLGTEGYPLNGSGTLIIYAGIVNIDTGDETLTPQKTMVVPAGVQHVLMQLDLFWAEAGSVIRVYAQSSNTSDTAVGGKVWVREYQATLQLCEGTEQADWDLRTAEQLEMNGSVLYYTATQDMYVTVGVQLGTAAAPLAGSDAVLIYATVVQADTGDETVMSQKIMVLPSGQGYVFLQTSLFGVTEGSSVKIYAKSTNSADSAVGGKVWLHYTSGTLTTTKQSIVNWIKAEFSPLQLATPDATLEQQIDNAIRYWNTHSAHRISGIYSYASTQKRVQLHNYFKSIAQVMPTVDTTWILRDHPMWTMLGITVLDNLTTDLIVMGQSFKNYRIYAGADMRWHFEMSQDPTVGGYLYIVNLPTNATSVCVVGTRRIASAEDIDSDYIKDWIQR